MYSTVRRYRISPGSEDKLIREIQEGFVPVISKLPGFREYLWVNAGNGVMFSVSVFENRAEAEDSSRRAADYVREHNLATLLPNAPEVTAGEVVVHHTETAKGRAAR